MPAETTSFVGRRSDITAVRKLLSTFRLVTVVGTGGVGKTRFALQVAREVRRTYPDGVYFAELASLTEPDLLPQMISDTLGIRANTATDALAILCDRLRDDRALVVLDNCEHLVDATALLVDRLLKAAPGVSIIATSRQSLRLDSERVYPLEPLLVPQPNTVEPGTSVNFPSVQLFAERAAAVVPGFAVTPDNEDAVVRVCHRLEGIPLALELAAVRLRVLDVDTLAARLDSKFTILRAGPRNFPERHQTLRALLDWSYDRCTLSEQLLWARSSVFAGGFTLEALEAVCVDDGLPSDDLLDALTGLIEKSVVSRVEHEKHIRFQTLETIREYGRHRLDTFGESDMLARRHRDWFAELGERATRDWAGPQQIDWAILLHFDHPNIQVALEYCMSRPDEVATGIRLATQPWFWAHMDHLGEAGLWIDRGLALLSEPSHELAWALATRAYIATLQGDRVVLADMPERARAVALEIDDRPALAVADHVIGFRQSLEEGQIRKAIPLFATALREYEEVGIDSHYKTALAIELATTHALLHDFDHARELTQSLYDRCTTSGGDRWGLSFALWLRGLITLLADDDAARAEHELVEALRIKRQLRDIYGLGLTLELLSWTAAAQGQAERAATIMGGADRTWKAIGRRLLDVKRTHYESQARSRIGAGRFDAALLRGRGLRTADIVSYSLREDAAPPDRTEQPIPLTPREREVAELVGKGMSNKEIAAHLVVSLRTAEGHVEKVLVKTGFKTRAQIASWITQLTIEGA